MEKKMDWAAITVPLDVTDIEGGTHYLRRWLGFEPTDRGLLFRCELANGEQVNYRVDVVEPDIVRVRMSQSEIHDGPSDMLLPSEPGRPAPSFAVQEQRDRLILSTARMRLEFPRYPWQMRAFARGESGQATPFFSQQCNDRAYGPYYEVPPSGFDEGADGRLTVRESVAVTPGEAFYGLGERFTSLEKWGQEVVLWATDSGNVSSPRSYKNVPFLMSTAGYGLFVHSSHPLVFRMGCESSISYSIHGADSCLDYYLIYGPDLKQILKRYADLAGHAPVPPKWSFGFWVSRAGYRSRKEVETVVREMRQRDLPCDVLSLDPWWMGDGPWSTYEWDTGAFPQPAEMVRGLREQGVRTCLWINPYLPAGTKAHADALAQGFLVSRPDGTISPVIEAFAGQDLAALDFTNPEARIWFQEKLRVLLDMGVAVFKTDFGEQAPVDAIYHDGRSGLEMHNLYPLLYNRTVFELTQAYFGRGFTWGRSAYAGSHRYPVQWGGDSYSSLDQMACQIRALLGYGLSGVPFSSHDVGGFDYPPQAFDHSERSSTWFLEEGVLDPVVYTRWLQFGVFSSHLRAHGKQPREPYAFGPQVEEIARRYLKLRYRLLPYIYSQAVRSAQTGLPMARAMALDFQDDLTTHHLDLQYLFGDSFLVAPVVRGDHRCRVYLPDGDWLDYWTKEVVDGPRWLDLEVPLDRLPLWVRAGAIIALGPEMTHSGELPLDPLTLELYLPRGEAYTVIHDEDRPDIPVHYVRQADSLTVEVGPSPGVVEIVLYGLAANAARMNGQSLDLGEKPGGQFVRFDGSAGARVEVGLVR
ncbi:MAG: glycoside hydrolase family 31 protein [Anaerolineae bacterium]|jgi:alpha-D-xyloside xylohydrolase